VKRLLHRCEYPRCWARRTVEARLDARRTDGTTTVHRQWFCDFHAEQLAKIAMRDRTARVSIYDDEDTDQPSAELLGFDAAVQRLALTHGIPLRQARRILEREKGRS